MSNFTQRSTKGSPPAKASICDTTPDSASSRSSDQAAVCGSPKKYTDLPPAMKEVCEAFIAGLKEQLGQKLYGVYTYGAAVFPGSDQATDVDCHVILKEALSAAEKENLTGLHKELAERCPPLGRDLDVWYILLPAAKQTTPPTHELKPEMQDRSWALHCAHIRAGYYITLFGPEPQEIFPLPSRPALAAALDHELDFIESSLKYPAYCTLNLCRIALSCEAENVVVSKRFSGEWAQTRYPQWSSLIQAAMRMYAGSQTAEDEKVLKEQVMPFKTFIKSELRRAKRNSDANNF